MLYNFYSIVLYTYVFNALANNLDITCEKGNLNIIFPND